VVAISYSLQSNGCGQTKKKDINMAKNTTRKGLAFGAAIALGLTGIASTPAVAAGMPDNTYVSLLPNAGTAYTVFTDSVFDIDANFASAVAGSGKDLKFRITDNNDLIKVDISHDGATDTLSSADAVTSVSGTNGATASDLDVITMILTTDIGLQVGDVITVAGMTHGTAGTATILQGLEGTFAVKTYASGSKTLTFEKSGLIAATLGATTPTGGTVVELTKGDALDTRANILLSPLGSAGVISSAAAVVDTRSTDDFIVVNSNEETNAADVAVRLVADTAETYSATVVAWIDNNNNNKIDATEYASPDRVVTFQKATEVVPTVAFNAVVVGDATLTATVSTTPKINFDMVGDSAFTVDFMRQGSALTVATAGYAETWTDLNSSYVVTQTINNTTSADNWNDIILATVATGTYTQAGTAVTVVSANTLSVNDVINVTTTGAVTAGVVLTASSTGFTYATAAAQSATVAAGTAFTGTNLTVQKYAFATAGTYKATVKVGETPAKIGSTFEVGAGVAIAASIANAATVTADVNKTFAVRKGTTGAVTVTTTVKNSAGVAVAAGVPVSIAASETSSGVVTVNGTTVTTSKTIATATDANGQVVITVTNASATAGDTVTLAVTSQGFSDSDVLTWEAASYLLNDSKDTADTKLLGRSIVSGGTVSFDIEVRDQFNTLLSGEARVKVALAGTRWSATSYETMSGGKATINIVDTPVAVATLTATATFTLQQKNTAGSWVDASGTAPTVAMATGAGEINADAVTVNIRSANGSSVTVNADAVSSADLSVASATTATAAANVGNAETAVDFTSDTGDVIATITGTVKDGFTGAGQGGSSVTVSGDSSILFRSGNVSAFGSITFFAHASTGVFTVDAYSNKAQIDSVVTVASNGASSTGKVTFAPALATAGTTLVLTAPVSALPGSTMTLKAKLTDKYGNAVQVTDTADILVTYVGPGIQFGTLPTTTDKNGELSVGVLLGSNDTGSATFTVSYDRSSDGDFTGTTATDLDIVMSKTVVVGAVASATKVTVGTFSGFTAVFVKGYEGKKLSVKLAGKWSVVPSIVDSSAGYYLFKQNTGVGYTADVVVYIDGVEVKRQTVVTK